MPALAVDAACVGLVTPTGAATPPAAGIPGAAWSAPAAAGCAPGAHTLGTPGDHLYPDTGNGGYRSIHTDVTMVYDATTDRFLAGNGVALTEQATQCLTSFSLDFEATSPDTTDGPDMTVGSVTVDGRPAAFTFVQPTYPGDPHGQADPDPAAHEVSQYDPVGGPLHNPLPPACSPELTSTDGSLRNSQNGDQCPADKLVITPARKIRSGTTFTVIVDYTGRPGVHHDGDGSTEGWFRSSDGGFVTTEPVGTEDWMPLNDFPTAKPTYDFYDTVGAGLTAIANGRLVSTTPGAPSAEFPAGSTTWHWTSSAPVASYLVEDSVGYYSLTRHGSHGDRLLRGPGRVHPRRPAAGEPHDHGRPAGITDFESRVQRALPVHLGGHHHRHPSGELRGGDADDDHLRRWHHRARRALPREHAPVVGRQRHRSSRRRRHLSAREGRSLSSCRRGHSTLFRPLST